MELASHRWEECDAEESGTTMIVDGDRRLPVTPSPDYSQRFGLVSELVGVKYVANILPISTCATAASSRAVIAVFPLTRA